MPSQEEISIPDGKGNWTKTKATKVAGQSQDEHKAKEAMAKAQESDFYTRVGRFTEHLNKVIRIYGKDFGLSASEVAAGVFLENCNIREHFPDGPSEHDKICEAMAQWHSQNKNR